MITAAGILFLTPDKRVLLLCRANDGDMGGTWCVPGGKLEDGEALERCAVRETREEVGKCPSGPRAVLVRSVGPIPPIPAVNDGGAEATLGDAPASPSPRDVDFTTYVQRVDAPFDVELNEEHTGYAWAHIDNVPEPLHPGVRLAIDRLSMDELGVARAIADGRLMSPQRYENVSLFAIRITGTGVAYRSGLDEFVFRNPENYLNDEFLARCNGLAVIWVHPQKAVLDSDEYADRAVGAVLLPFIPGPGYLAANPNANADEVWGVAKVYDDDTIKFMMENPASTSPTVVFRDPESNAKLTLEDGSALLIEGKPSLLDHVALLDCNGVWDKGGDLIGVDRSGVEARADAAGVVTTLKRGLDPKRLARLDRTLTLLSARMSNHAAQRR